MSVDLRIGRYIERMQLVPDRRTLTINNNALEIDANPFPSVG